MLLPEQELKRLFDAEYGNRAEIAVRGTGIVLVALVLWQLFGWSYAPLWAAAYFGLHIPLLAVFLTRPAVPRPRDLRLIHLLTLALFAVFFVMPSLAVASGQEILAQGGGSAICCALLYVLHRGDDDPLLRHGYVAVVLACTLLVMAMVLPRMESTGAAVAFAVGPLAVLFYFVQMLRNGRTQRAAVQRAAELGLQQEKLAAIGRLAGGVAHDFNNLLTVIGGNLELARDTRDAADRHHLIDEAQTATRRAASIVEQLMIYARRSDDRGTTFDAAGLVQDVAAMSRRFLPRSIDLSVTVPPTPVAVETSEERLVTALLNLLSNAADAMDNRGRVDLSLSVEAGTALFRIRDRGPGIPAEHLDRIFDPFFTTKPVGRGTGLGLSMALGFAESAGGTLRVFNAAEGAEATLRLPLADATRPEMPLPQRAAHPTARGDAQQGAGDGSLSLP